MIIALDTSCYTTSLAVLDDQGSIFLDRRILLEVKHGQMGLRQSEAVFQHLQNLPQLLKDNFSGIAVTAVCAATIPRPVSDSYLPVFKVGAAFGETLAKLLGVPFYNTSHQEGHIRAALFNQEIPELFLVWHLSGGTTELLLARSQEAGFQIEKIGGSSDLQVGQFIDRVGVALGTSFPAGPALEKLAQASDSHKALPVVSQGLTTSFSGPAAAAERLIAAGVEASELARQVFNCVSRSLLKVTLQAVKDFEIKQVLLVGGVASNQLIRSFLGAEGEKEKIQFIFGAKELSSDNAVGVGLLGVDFLKKG